MAPVGMLIFFLNLEDIVLVFLILFNYLCNYPNLCNAIIDRKST